VCLPSFGDCKPLLPPTSKIWLPAVFFIDPLVVFYLCLSGVTSGTLSLNPYKPYLFFAFPLHDRPSRLAGVMGELLCFISLSPAKGYASKKKMNPCG